MATLATLDDFFRLGLPPAACVPVPRPIEAVDVASDRVLARGHGLLAGDVLKFRGQGALPSPLSATAIYKAAPVDGDLFGLLYADGPSAGLPVDLLTEGARPIEYLVDPRPAIERELAAASSLVQDHLTAHGPVDSPTEVIVKVVCTVAAYQIAMVRGMVAKTMLEGLRDSLEKRHEEAQVQLRRWLAGRPVAGLTDTTPLLADNGPMGALVSAPIVIGAQWGYDL